MIALAIGIALICLAKILKGMLENQQEIMRAVGCDDELVKEDRLHTLDDVLGEGEAQV